MTEGLVRRGGPEDLELVARLEGRSFGAADGGFSPSQLARLVKNPRALWLITASGLGAACWLRANNGRARWGRLYSLAVDPAARRQGLARTLVEAGLVALRAEGFTRFVAECRLDNAPARALYASLGFREGSVLVDYYGPGLDGIKLLLN